MLIHKMLILDLIGAYLKYNLKYLLKNCVETMT